MSDTYEYASRPGHTGLSLVALTGLTVFAVMLWDVAPGYVVLLLIPALGVSLWQMTMVPVYGLRLGRATWQIMGGHEDLDIPTAKIAYLRMTERGESLRVTLVLVDATEIEIPTEALPAPLDLIREAIKRGVPVRDV